MLREARFEDRRPGGQPHTPEARLLGRPVAQRPGRGSRADEPSRILCLPSIHPGEAQAGGRQAGQGPWLRSTGAHVVCLCRILPCVAGRVEGGTHNHSDDHCRNHWGTTERRNMQQQEGQGGAQSSTASPHTLCCWKAGGHQCRHRRCQHPPGVNETLARCFLRNGSDSCVRGMHVGIRARHPCSGDRHVGTALRTAAPRSKADSTHQQGPPLPLALPCQLCETCLHTWELTVDLASIH